MSDPKPPNVTRETDSNVGYSDDYAEDLLFQLKGKERHHHSHSPSGSRDIVVVNNTHETLVDMERPTWIRINRKHILPETLNAFRLKWDYDDVSYQPVVSDKGTLANILISYRTKISSSSKNMLTMISSVNSSHTPRK